MNVAEVEEDNDKMMLIILMMKTERSLNFAGVARV